MRISQTTFKIMVLSALLISTASLNLPVYAKVFKNQLDAAAGNYTDTITITLTY